MATPTGIPPGCATSCARPGTGPTPAHGSEVVVHYDGYLLDGTKFDSSRDRGAPYVFRVGTGSVIAGWDEALAAMKAGEQRTLIVPWWLAYGEASHGKIPPRPRCVSRSSCWKSGRSNVELRKSGKRPAFFLIP
jgi:FKBP-type peptidyl-prolyl cis-trans isomerase